MSQPKTCNFCSNSDSRTKPISSAAYPMHLQYTMTDSPLHPLTKCDCESVDCSSLLSDGCIDVAHHGGSMRRRRQRRRHASSEVAHNSLHIGARWLLTITLATATVNAFSMGGMPMATTTKIMSSMTTNREKPYQFRAHGGTMPLLILDDELTTMTASSKDTNGDEQNQPLVTRGPQRLSGAPGIEVISSGGSPQIFSPFLSLKPFPTWTRQQQQLRTTMSMSSKTTTMFLNPPKQGISVPSASISGTRQHPSSFQQQLEEGDDENTSRRGVLGFDVAMSLSSNAQTSSERSSSALSSSRSRRSNVDLDSWNDPTTTHIDSTDDGEDVSGVEQYFTSRRMSRLSPTASSTIVWREGGFAPGSTASSFFFRRPSTPSLLKKNGSATTFTVTQSPARLPPWFPYIPSKSQIESLKVSELKEACAQRGLVKVSLA